jgi:hypothetical protein
VKTLAVPGLHEKGLGGGMTARPSMHLKSFSASGAAGSYVGRRLAALDVKEDLRHGGEGIAACRGEAHPT